jgi:hypothetical protein
MIRFACPSCNSVFTVADEKGGKTGQCPKCQSQFAIPEAEAGSPPPPAAPPPMPARSDIEIEPCPGCQAKLTVEPGDLGKDVECPYCKTAYIAKDPNARRKTPPTKRARVEEVDEYDDDDDRLRRRRDRFGEDRDDDDDDIDDNRPRRRRKGSRGTGKSGAVTTVAILNFVFGGLGLLCSCGMFGLGAVSREIFQRAAAQGNGQKLPLDPDMMMVIFMVLGVMYLVLAILMIIAGIGLQQRKPYGRFLTFATASLAILLALFGCVSLVGNVVAGQGAGILGALFGILLWGGYGVFALITMIRCDREFQ